MSYLTAGKNASVFCQRINHNGLPRETRVPSSIVPRGFLFFEHNRTTSERNGGQRGPEAKIQRLAFGVVVPERTTFVVTVAADPTCASRANLIARTRSKAEPSPQK